MKLIFVQTFTFIDTKGYIVSYICVVSDINECDLNTHNCSNNAQCFNTNESFVCNCNDGFSGNGVICEGMLTINFLWAANKGELKYYRFP